MLLATIPGFNKALESASKIDAFRRDFAFLGLPLAICGVEVCLMTLRQYLRLLLMENPFIVGGTVIPEHVAQFLWLISPSYMEPFSGGMSFARARARKAAATRRRKEFVRSLYNVPLAKAQEEIEQYLKQIFADSPSATGANGIPVTSFVAVYIEIIRAEYGGSDDDVLDTSLPVLHQHIRRIVLRNNPKAAIIDHRTDKIKREFFKKWIASQKKEKAR